MGAHFLSHFLDRVGVVRIGCAALPPVSVPTEPEAFQAGQRAGGPFGFLSAISRSNYLLGDM
jgi:hypothetical protein